jgi:hypothetical protein
MLVGLRGKAIATAVPRRSRRHLCRQGDQLERVFLALLEHEAIVAQPRHLARVVEYLRHVERDVRGSQARIGLSQWQQGLDVHSPSAS